jgi:hypothetical protein
VGLIVFGVYSFVAGLDWPGREHQAERHGRAVFGLEQRLHLDIEPALNRWLAPHPVLRVLANYEYASTYLIAAFVLIVWLYLRRPAEYRPARTSFLLLNLGGVACFALYPVTPPRLVPGLDFIDTVRLGHTWGSWGSPMVEHANQLAAMPSLHIAWAVWVSVVLAQVRAGRLVQWLSGLHVLSTVTVIMATANHYLLDAVGGALLVLLCWWVMRLFQPPPGAPPAEPVPAADAFFLHVDSPLAPQQVGGIAMLDTSETPLRQGALAAVIREHLAEIPRFHQRLSFAPHTRIGRLFPWYPRKPRWVDAGELDWAWHVPARDLTRPDGQPGGLAALREYVAELAGEQLPRDRPLWRFVAVTGIAADRAAGVLIVHHVVADGIGTVAQAMNLLVPRISLLDLGTGDHGPGPVKRFLATVAGLAQLATDRRPRGRLPYGATARRTFVTVDLPLPEVRAVAKRHSARVSDVLMTSLAGALRRVGTGLAAQPTVTVAVPLMAREPGAAAEGNLTAAVMMDLSLATLSEPERLAEVARSGRRLRGGTRVLASRFVMGTIGGLMPVPLHAWFARTVYGHRIFQAIVSNMPGPQVPLSLAGPPLAGVYPILPLAPRAPLAVGALGWDGYLHVALCADPALIDDGDALAAAVLAVFAELRAAAPVKSLTSDVRTTA